MNDFYRIYEERTAGLCPAEAAGDFLTLYDTLTEYNGKFNLTAIRSVEDYLSKHIADCAAAARYIGKRACAGAKLIDVGSGAGFPAIPIAALLRGVSVTALDSTAKKLDYIAEAAARLSLTNLTTSVGRAEELGASSARETYDIATARAVARLNVLVELCAPLVAVGGYFIAMKGAAAKEEADEAARGAALLGLGAAEVIPYSLPLIEDSRYLVVYRKLSPTPDRYPRQYAKIVKKPL